jgi:hypothetical protein
MDYFVHNGYCGWSYGTPSNPQVLLESDALKLMQITGLNLEQVSTQMPPAQFTEKNTELYELFAKNRFLQYGRILDCTDINNIKISEPLNIIWD